MILFSVVSAHPFAVQQPKADLPDLIGDQFGRMTSDGDGCWLSLPVKNNGDSASVDSVTWARIIGNRGGDWSVSTACMMHTPVLQPGEELMVDCVLKIKPGFYYIDYDVDFMENNIEKNENNNNPGLFDIICNPETN